MARSYTSFSKNFLLLEKYFPHILLVKNNEDLNKIHFCFKTKLGDSNAYAFQWNKNLLKVGEKEEDIALIKDEYVKILERITDASEFKQVIEAYLK